MRVDYMHGAGKHVYSNRSGSRSVVRKPGLQTERLCRWVYPHTPTGTNINNYRLEYEQVCVELPKFKWWPRRRKLRPGQLILARLCLA